MMQKKNSKVRQIETNEGTEATLRTSNIEISKLKGKVWNALGDSITQGYLTKKLIINIYKKTVHWVLLIIMGLLVMKYVQVEFSQIPLLQDI